LPITCRGRCVAQAINRIASHFESTPLLSILIGVQRQS
jgi:hypothetical protein